MLQGGWITTRALEAAHPASGAWCSITTQCGGARAVSPGWPAFLCAPWQMGRHRSVWLLRATAAFFCCSLAGFLCADRGFCVCAGAQRHRNVPRDTGVPPCACHFRRRFWRCPHGQRASAAVLPPVQIPLAPCKGRGRFPAHEEKRLCLPSGSVGTILGKATSTADYRSTVNQTKQTKNLQCSLPLSVTTAPGVSPFAM